MNANGYNSLAYACMHAGSYVMARGTGMKTNLQPNVYMCPVNHALIIHGHLQYTRTCQHILHSYFLTAFTRLSALGMCSKSTKGWVKNSAKVIRASGFLSSSRNRRSLQFLDTLAPGGSSCTKYDLIMLHSIHRTSQRKRTADCCQRPSSLTSLPSVKR